jgi:hypothetical protein
VESEFVHGFGARLPAKAVEFLPMDSENVSQVAAPAQHGAEDVVEIGQIHPIGDRDYPDDHRADMAKNCS